MPTRFRYLAFGVLGLVLFAGRAHAATIGFTATDLGGNKYRFDYRVSGATVTELEGFSVFFDPIEVLSLDGETTLNADWLLSVLQPDPTIPDFGRFDLIALADNASVANVFSINATLAAGRAPGPQPFNLLAIDADFNILRDEAAGTTVPLAATPVPEPGTLLLLGTGGAGLIARLRRRRAQASA